MEYRWVGRKINIKSATEKIEQFLRERNFNVEKNENSEAIYLTATQHLRDNTAKHVIVKISKTSKDFSVKFEGEQTPRFALEASSLLIFLGGGLILRKELKSAEFYKKMEEEFWKRVEEIVAESTLTDEMSTS